MTQSFEFCLVRILNTKGMPVGAGFIVAKRLVLTCGHVVIEAIRNSPEALIDLDFPFLLNGSRSSAQISICDESADIAVLQLLSDPPEGAQPARLVDTTDLWGHSFRAFGFPRGNDSGVWVSGRILAQTASGWLQIEDIKTTGYTVQPGFSGGPLWDEELNAVVGMVVASDSPQIRAAYGLTIKEITTTCPWIGEIAIPPCPYRGLLAYREQDTGLFFGREVFSQILFDAVQNRSLVAVVGPSGSGKSSVVFSGLLPKLRVQQECVILDFRPGSHPFDALALALLLQLETNISETDRLVETRKLAAAMQNRDVLLGEVLRRVFQKCTSANRLLIIADQFEELYTHCPEMARSQPFIDVLLEACEIPGVTLLITMRADFYGQALAHRPFADALQAAVLNLGPMNENEIRQVIEQPALSRQVRFEAGLVERILVDVQGQPGALPLLEFCLTLLWYQQVPGRLTHVAYEAIGKVGGALAQYAEEEFSRLSSSEMEQARKVFTQLVTPVSGAVNTRRLVTQSELGTTLWRLVKRLADARLVVTNQTLDGEESVEIVHEALIRNWDRLGNWIDSDRDFRSWQERFRVGLRQWQGSSQDEGALLRGVPLAEAEGWMEQRGEELSVAERGFFDASLGLRQREVNALKAQQHHELDQARRLFQTERQRTSILAIGFVIFLFLAVLSWGFYRQSQTTSMKLSTATAQAEQQGRTAEVRRLEAEQLGTISLARQIAMQALVMIEQNQDNELSILLALEAVRIAQTNGGLYLFEANNTLRKALASAPLIIDRHKSDYVRLAFSPDGSRAATSGTDLINIIDTRNGEKLITINAQEIDGGPISFSADGERLVTGCKGGYVSLFDAFTGKKIMMFNHGEENCLVSFSASDSRILTYSHDLFSGSDGMIHYWNSETGELLLTLYREKGRRAYQLSEKAVFQAEVQMDGSVLITELLSGSKIGLQPEFLVKDFAFSPDANKLALFSNDGALELRDIKNGQLIFSYNHETSKPGAEWGYPPTSQQESQQDTDTNVVILFSPNSHLVAASFLDNSIELWNADTGESITTYAKLDSKIEDLLFSPDGNRLAITSENGTAHLFDLETKKELAVLQHGINESIVSGKRGPRIYFNSTGTRFISTSYNGIIHIINAVTGAEVSEINTGSGFVRFQLSPDGTRLAIVNSDSSSRSSIDSDGYQDYYFGQLIDIDNGKILATYRSRGMIYWPVFSEDNMHVAFPTAEGFVYVLNTDSGQEMAVLKHTGQIFYVKFSLDGNKILTSGEENVARLWNLPPENEPMIYRMGEAVRKIAFSPDGTRLVAIGEAGKVQLFDAVTKKEISTFHHDGLIRDFEFNPDGSILVTIGRDGKALFIDTNSGTLLRETKIANELYSVAFSPHGTQVAFGSIDNIFIYDGVDGNQLAVFPYNFPIDLSYSPKMNLLVAASINGNITIWNAITGSEIATMNHGGEVRKLVISPDGSRLAVIGFIQVSVWNLDNYEQVALLHVHQYSPQGLMSWGSGDIEFSIDSRYLATSTLDGTGKLVDASTGKELASLVHKPAEFRQDGGTIISVRDVDFSQDGTRLATAGDDQTARLWNIKGQEVATINHANNVLAIEFSQDGKYLATASLDNTARLVDAATGIELAVLLHQGAVNDIVFSHDGTYLVTASADTKVRFWRVRMEDLVQYGCRLMTRNLSKQEWNSYIGNKSLYHETCPGLLIPDDQGLFPTEEAILTETQSNIPTPTKTNTPAPTLTLQTLDESYPHPYSYPVPYPEPIMLTSTPLPTLLPMP